MLIIYWVLYSCLIGIFILRCLRKNRINFSLYISWFCKPWFVDIIFTDAELLQQRSKFRYQYLQRLRKITSLWRGNDAGDLSATVSFKLCYKKNTWDFFSFISFFLWHSLKESNEPPILWHPLFPLTYY